MTLLIYSGNEKHVKPFLQEVHVQTLVMEIGDHLSCPLLLVTVATITLLSASLTTRR